MSTLSTIHEQLTEQIDRTTDLRWQAVLHYVRTVEQSGGKTLLAFDGDQSAECLRLVGVPVGGHITYLTRSTGTRKALSAAPTEYVDVQAGEWVLHGLAGREDLWQVAGAYRYVCAVTSPDEPTEQVHVLLRVEADQ